MIQSRRHIAIFAAAAALAFISYSNSHAAGANDPSSPGRAQLEQAAKSVAEGAKEAIANARSDSEAIKRAQTALSILYTIGDLGGFSTAQQCDQLIADVRATARPAVVETLAQIQFGGKLMTWHQLSEAERSAALDQLVADIKHTGLTKQYADLLLRLSGQIGESDEKRVANAINQAISAVRNPNDVQMKRISQNLAGIARRLELVGKPMELEGSLLDGSKLNWADYKGKVVLVDFSASWCGPCRAEAPNVLRNFRAYHDKGFEVVTVSLDVDPSKAEQSIKDSGCDFPTLFSEDSATRGWDHPMVTKFGVNGIPTAILVGRDGKVLSTNARGEKLNELLAAQFGPPAAGFEAPRADRSSSTKNDREVVQASDVETN